MDIVQTIVALLVSVFGSGFAIAGIRAVKRAWNESVTRRVTEITGQAALQAKDVELARERELRVDAENESERLWRLIDDLTTPGQGRQ